MSEYDIATDECTLCGDESTASKTLCAHCGLHFCNTENAGCFERHEAGISGRMA